MEKEKFAGIFPALMTAFDGDSGIDTYSIARLVEKLRADGVNGLYVGGSSAEMILCSTEERRKILEGVMSASDGLTIIAHIGAASTNDSLELARHAVMCGVDAISSVTPFYYKYRFDEVKHYYERFADVGLPLIIYNIPALTGASYGFDQLCELLEIPGVEGMKFTSSDFYLLNRLAAKYPEKVFYNGSDEMLLSGLAAGADGGIGTTYNFMPDVFGCIWSLFSEGRMYEALELQRIADRVISVVLKYGSVVGSKQMTEYYGVPYGICREPFLPLDESAKNDLYENAWKLLESWRNTK